MAALRSMVRTSAGCPSRRQAADGYEATVTENGDGRSLAVYSVADKLRLPSNLYRKPWPALTAEGQLEESA
jgi:hypothetical protein